MIVILNTGLYPVYLFLTLMIYKMIDVVTQNKLKKSLAKKMNKSLLARQEEEPWQHPT